MIDNKGTDSRRPPPLSAATANVPEIHMRLTTLSQLFNSMDPSPFHERELDAAADAFIVDSLEELSSGHTPVLVIELPAEQMANYEAAEVQRAIQNHFTYRLNDSRRRLRRHFREGRIALLIGLLFLAICNAVREFIFMPQDSAVARLFAEGLLILGWVAMWRPLQIFLYDWWPLRRQARLHARLAAAPVKLQAVRTPQENA